MSLVPLNGLPEYLQQTPQTIDWAFYRKLNERTRLPRYPLPRIQQALDCLQGKAYFSAFDFPAAYYQIEVEPGLRRYLAFIMPHGH